MPPSIGLPAVNFFLGDIGGGLGPFLSTWLASVAHWNPGQIGTVIMAGSVAAIVLSAPAGAVIDRIGRPKLILIISSLVIMAGTGALLLVRAFIPIMLTQMMVAAAGALAAPAATALTLSIVGKDGFPRQQGTNEASKHAGNVAAAGMIWALTFAIGATASVAVLALMVLGTLVALTLIPSSAIDHKRMAGRDRPKRGDKQGGTWAVLRSRRLLILVAAISLFHLGNGAVLPLLGQKLAGAGNVDPTQWMAQFVIVAQLVMVPVAWLAGRFADQLGRRFLLIAACAVLPVRGVLAMLFSDPYWMVGMEALDGVGAGLVSVAAPLAVADLTYGSGRTQTAMGAMATMQAVAAALSATIGGQLAQHAGWPAAFGTLSVFPLFAIALLLTIQLRDEKPDGQAGEKAAAISARV